jgi:plastocyanin
MPRIAFASASAAILALAACSSGGGDNGTTGVTTTGASTPTITISGMNWGPSNLTVAAGATITVINNDTASPHTVTSEPLAASYDAGVAPGGFSFNTHLIGVDGGVATIQVPAGLASGLVMPYFCEIHTNTMNPPDPTITIK